MDNLQCRAWDKEHREMLEVHGISFDVQGIWTNEMIDDESDGNFIFLSDVELLQYTGLKDKNGTEIFEGDILKYWGECRPVVSHEASFGWIEGGHYIPFPMMCISEIGNTEVVGNIYENKEELL